MTERGGLYEIVVPVFGPVKLRTVREEWYAAGGSGALTAIVPRHSHLTLHGEPGKRRLCTLEGVPSNVDVNRGRW